MTPEKQKYVRSRWPQWWLVGMFVKTALMGVVHLAGTFAGSLLGFAWPTALSGLAGLVLGEVLWGICYAAGEYEVMERKEGGR